MTQAVLDLTVIDTPETMSGAEIAIPHSEQGYHLPFSAHDTVMLGNDYDVRALDAVSRGVTIPETNFGNAEAMDSNKVGRVAKVMRWLREKVAGASMYAKAGVGLSGALGAYAATGAEVAHADYECEAGDPGWYPTVVVNPDGSQMEIYMCPDNPPTTPKPPVTTVKPPQTTQPSSGGGGNNSGGGSGNTDPTQETNPNVEQNADVDAWSIVVNKNDGSKVGGWDVDDNSPGLGQEGIDQYMAELAARGLDPNNPTYYNDSIRLIVQTVNPEDWPKYLNQILNIPTTTTSTLAASTTTTEGVATTTIDSNIATSTTYGRNNAGNDSASGSDQNSGASDTDKKDFSAMPVVLGVGGSLSLGALLLALRRRPLTRQKTKSEATPVRADDKPHDMKKPPTLPGGMIGVGGGN